MVNMPIVSQASSSNDPEVISGAAVATYLSLLGLFLRRYQDQVQRAEQERHLEIYVEGLVSGIERKSIEPIATCRAPRPSRRRSVHNRRLSWSSSLEVVSAPFGPGAATNFSPPVFNPACPLHAGLLQLMD
jgi:hypothetical protein